jgi:hypothetical protein
MGKECSLFVSTDYENAQTHSDVVSLPLSMQFVIWVELLTFTMRREVLTLFVREGGLESQ